MTKYTSKDFKDLKVGISSFSDGKTSLEVIGRLGVNTSTSENAVDVVGSVNISEDLYVSGVSTFVGVGTFGSDLYVGGDLYVKDDVVFDEIVAKDLNITGVATVGTAFTVNGPSNLVDTFVSGALTATTFTGAGTGLTGITSATNATNIYGGATGQLLYQAQPGITSAFESGSTNLILASRGPNNPPQWVASAPAGAVEGILIFDEGGQVGLGTTYSGLDFRGLDVTVTGGNNGGIATITVSQQTYVEQAGVSTSVVGGAASVTQLNVDVGISSFADFKITSSGVGATVGASAGITTYYGRGTELTGIVTTITAGPNIAIDQSIGNVTITGLADTSVVVSDSLFVTGITTLNTVSANSLIVSGITTLGVVTGATYYGNGNNLTGIVTSLIAGANISLSGSQGEVTITGLAYTANVVADSLFVTGVSTLGIITGAESIGVTTIYTENIVGGTATFSGNVTIGGTLTYEDVSNVDSVGFVTARSGLNVGYSTGPSGIGATILPDGNAVFAGTVTATSFTGDGSNIIGINSFAKELRQDADGNIFAGDSTTGGGYDPSTGSACFNIFMGCNAGNSITEGDFNFFAGSSAGRCNTTGSSNNFIGNCAGQNNTTGSYNNFLGQCAGKCNTTGGFNNFLGNSAGFNNTTGSGNNFFGDNAGLSNTTGDRNNFFGFWAGRNNTTGGYNNFLGNYAGQFNTTGSFNNFIGREAGLNNTTGSCNNMIGRGAGQCATVTGQHNTFLGTYAGKCASGSGAHNNFFGCGAGYFNTIGSYNNFFGLNAGRCNTTGGNNNFLGCNAGYFTTGGSNNFFGNSAGFSNTTGSHNNFLGQGAGQNNTTGSFNNFSGYLAGKFNTTGFNNNFFGDQTGCANTTGSLNNFLGGRAGQNNTTGSCNNFFGYQAGQNNTTGFNNNFFGNGAGLSNTTGCFNNFLGFQAGRLNTTGTNNNFFGCGAGCNNTTGSNNIAFGFNAGQTSGSPSGLIDLTTSDNCIIMGNANHSCAAIQVAWTVISDIRDKCVYGDVPHGRGFLQNINPIKYSFKNRETNEVTDERVRYGFSAQEVAELEGDETIIASKSNIDKWGVTHEHLLPVLVNAIKELDVENQELKERLSSLEEKVNSLLNN